MSNAQDLVVRLHESVAATAPIIGVSVPKYGESATVLIEFSPAATQAQKTAAQNVVNAFDWSDTATAAWLNLRNRVAAGVLLSSTAADHKLLRALMLVMLDEINTIRARPGVSLPARTAAQLRTAVQNKIDGGTADT